MLQIKRFKNPHWVFLSKEPLFPSSLPSSLHSYWHLFPSIFLSSTYFFFLPRSIVNFHFATNYVGIELRIFSSVRAYFRLPTALTQHHWCRNFLFLLESLGIFGENNKFTSALFNFAMLLATSCRHWQRGSVVLSQLIREEEKKWKGSRLVNDSCYFKHLRFSAVIKVRSCLVGIFSSSL